MRWRETKGNGSLRFIGVAGVGTLILLLVVAAGLKRVAFKDDNQRATATAGQGAFKGERAFETLKRIVAIGPRPPASPEAETLRQLIRGEVEAAGLEVRILPFEADTPLGKKSMANLVAVVKGSKDGIIALSNHYDTKHFEDFRFVGANDGGSTTAWMIEMARALGPAREGRTVWLIWFDGEEAFKEWSST
ncbi:MAG: M28 family peptidase, partial [Candidatus Hydrogenedentes bacterium]|nr:M28 family peptidase [Candidatus Hydrogenedentota bacterium]